MKHFSRLALASLLLGAITLGGCAQLQNFAGKVESAVSSIGSAQVSYKQALAAVASFEALQRAGEVYLRQPTCTNASGLICHDRRATKTIVALSAAGRVARKQVLDFMDAHPCASGSCPLMPDGVYQGLMDVIADLNAIYDTYKVAKGG